MNLQQIITNATKYTEYTRKNFHKTAEEFAAIIAKAEQKLKHNTFWIDIYKEMMEYEVDKFLKLQNMRANSGYYAFAAIFMLAFFYQFFSPTISPYNFISGLLGSNYTLATAGFFILGISAAIIYLPQLQQFAHKTTLHKLEQFFELKVTYIDLPSQNTKDSHPEPQLAIFLVSRVDKSSENTSATTDTNAIIPTNKPPEKVSNVSRDRR